MSTDVAAIVTAVGTVPQTLYKSKKFKLGTQDIYKDILVYILPLTGVASTSLPLQHNFCRLRDRKQVVHLDFF